MKSSENQSFFDDFKGVVVKLIKSLDIEAKFDDNPNI